MDGASRIGADLAQCPDLVAVGHDSLRRELAHLELRPFRFVLASRLLGANIRVLVARECGAAFLLLPVRRADRDKIGLGGDGRGNLRRDLGLIASRVGTLCGIWATRKSFLLAPRLPHSQNGKHPA